MTVALLCNIQCLFSQTFTPVKVSNKAQIMELETVENIRNVMVAVIMGANPKNFTICRSTNSGVTWNSVFFYQSDASFLGSPDPVIACDSAGTFYVTVMRTGPVSNPTSNKANLWVFKSIDDGITWTQPSKPYTGNNKADYPQLLIDKKNNRIYLSYTVYNFTSPTSSWVQFVYSTDGALTWSSPISFQAPYVPPPAYFHALGPDLGLLPNNKICLSFGDYNLGQIYFTSSSDLGNTWQPKTTIPINTSTNLLITKVVSHPGFNHLGIISHKPHKAVADVYYSTSTNGGSTWQTQLIGSNASLGEGTIDNTGKVHVVFNQDVGGNFQLNYRYSTDFGVTFSPNINLLNLSYPSPTTEGEYQSLILGNDNLLHLTFIDWNDTCIAKHLMFAPLLTSFAEFPDELNVPKIFPNPVQDIINIKFETNNLASTFELADMQGKFLLRGDLGNGCTALSGASLPPGIYLLKIYCGNNIYVQKLLKR